MVSDRTGFCLSCFLYFSIFFYEKVLIVMLLFDIIAVVERCSQTKGKAGQRTMTDLEMMNKLAEGRKVSEMYGWTVWAMGNGNEIVLAYSEDSHESFVACGYWTVTIFENGVNIGLGI